MRRRLAAVTALLTAAWAAISAILCSSCYRLGNFLDFYFQRELLLTLGPTHGADPHVPTLLAAGIWRGVMLRRVFRFRWLAPAGLIETMHPWGLVIRPPQSLWEHPDAGRVLQMLLNGAPTSRTYGRATSDFFLWWDHDYLRLLLPYLRASIRRAVAQVRSAELAALRTTARQAHRSRTCVVHFRAGDFTNEVRGGWSQERVRRSISAMVAAVRTFPAAVDRFEVLGGGITHRCTPALADCGTSALDEVCRALRRAFPNASVVSLRDGSADDDFVRMVDAPMLLLGSGGTDLKVGSSYAVYAAVANTGLVRLPGCFLRFGHCAQGQKAAAIADGWRGYEHPHCARCRPRLSRAPSWTARQ